MKLRSFLFSSASGLFIGVGGAFSYALFNKNNRYTNTVCAETRELDTRWKEPEETSFVVDNNKIKE